MKKKPSLPQDAHAAQRVDAVALCARALAGSRGPPGRRRRPLGRLYAKLLIHLLVNEGAVQRPLRLAAEGAEVGAYSRERAQV